MLTRVSALVETLTTGASKCPWQASQHHAVPTELNKHIISDLHQICIQHPSLGSVTVYISVCETSFIVGSSGSGKSTNALPLLCAIGTHIVHSTCPICHRKQKQGLVCIFPVRPSFIIVPMLIARVHARQESASVSGLPVSTHSYHDCMGFKCVCLVLPLHASNLDACQPAELGDLARSMIVSPPHRLKARTP